MPYKKNIVIFLFLCLGYCSIANWLEAAPISDPIKDGVYIWKNEDTGQRMGITVKTVAGVQSYSFTTETYGADNWSPMVRKTELDDAHYIVITVESERLIDLFTFHIKMPQEKANAIQVSIYTDRSTYLEFVRQ